MWAGVDVGGRRKGFHVAFLDEGGLVGAPVQIRTVDEVADRLRARRPRVIAVDSPRRAAIDGHRSRECERALARAICGIRFTPEQALLEGNGYYAWIVHGLELYTALAARSLEVIECFPTASLTRWAGRRGSRTRAAWSRAALAARGFPDVPGGQDGRDAVAAALTARCYAEGRFDAFGEIIVPEPEPASASARSGRRSEAGSRARETGAPAAR
jgi:predicted nuclease with RNAse H fold